MMKLFAIAIAVALLNFSLPAQEYKNLKVMTREVSVALPANILPPPFQVNPCKSMGVELITGKPLHNFPGTVYFNPGEKYVKYPKLPLELSTLNAIRFYLDTSVWDVDLKNLPSEQVLPLKLKDNNVQRFFDPFYFKKSEVTNSEYREFTSWVRDSIARSLLAQIYPGKYFKPNSKALNWKTPIDWEGKDEKAANALSVLFYDENDRLSGKRELDTRKFIYTYKGKDNTLHNVPVYPDTLVWIKDFPYSFNEFQYGHFHHKAYDGYPVTGVNFEQVKAFCHWKTQQIQRDVKSDYQVEVDLPFDYEREYVMNQYASEQLSDMGCIADLMAVKKQEFFPSQLNEILNCRLNKHMEGTIPHFKTHLADLSRISPRKRELIPDDVDENNISGLDDNVSEWMNESYQTNWLPYITKRRQLLEMTITAIRDSFPGKAIEYSPIPDSVYTNRLYCEYLKEVPLIMRLEELFNSYCDTDGMLVRGGNWMDNRCFLNNPIKKGEKKVFHKDAMTFVSPHRSSSMIGFRYVIRIRRVK